MVGAVLSALPHLSLGGKVDCISSMAGFTLAFLSLGLCSNLLATTYTLVIGTCGVGRIRVLGWILAVAIYGVGLWAVCASGIKEPKEKEADTDIEMAVRCSMI